MIKHVLRLESVIGSRVGHFFIDNDLPSVVAKEMCKQFIAYIESVEADAEAKKKEIKEESENLDAE